MTRPSEMTYEDALVYLDGLIDFEKVGANYFGADRFQLATVRRLLEGLGSPHQRLACLHIAGTKGKGSTAAMCDALLRAAGFRVGLFTKPHLVDVRERTRLDGRMIEPGHFARMVRAMRPVIDEINADPQSADITYYEAQAALALTYFAEQEVDFAVVETGLGGRLDATNVLIPLVCGITRVDFDHVDLLGDTLAAIAAEKAGILKPGVPCVVAPQEPEALAPIAARAAEVGAPLLPPAAIEDARETFTLRVGEARYDGLRLPLHGTYQRVNAATGLAMVHALGAERVRLQPEQVGAGLAQVRLRGRFDIVREQPTVVLDVAHNAVSARALRETLQHVLAARRPLIAVVGLQNDKDAEGFARELFPVCDAVVLTRFHGARSLPPEELARRVAGFAPRGQTAASVAGALAEALAQAGTDGAVCVTGSFHIVGEAMEALGVALE